MGGVGTLLYDVEAIFLYSPYLFLPQKNTTSLLNYLGYLGYHVSPSEVQLRCLDVVYLDSQCSPGSKTLTLTGCRLWWDALDTGSSILPSQQSHCTKQSERFPGDPSPTRPLFTCTLALKPYSNFQSQFSIPVTSKLTLNRPMLFSRPTHKGTLQMCQSLH